MLTRLEKAQQKWGGSHSVIDKWLTERQELLVLFCRIAGFSPYEKKDHALPDQLQIQKLLPNSDGLPFCWPFRNLRRHCQSV